LIGPDDNSYRALSRGDFYSSGFMTEGDPLPFGQFLGNVEPQQIASAGERSSTLLNDAVVVRPPAGATYRVGDSLLVVRLAEGYSGSPQWGDIVVPTALLEVTSGGSGDVRGRVLAIYGEIRNTQMVLPAEQFVSSGTARAQPVQNGISGRIIKARGQNPLRHPQDVLFLDVGRAAGVARGDVFEVLREEDGMTGVTDRIATLQVVHVRESTATVRVVSVLQPNFPERATVRKIAALGN
jgi:hypothetical protein